MTNTGFGQIWDIKRLNSSITPTIDMVINIFDIHKKNDEIKDKCHVISIQKVDGLLSTFTFSDITVPITNIELQFTAAINAYLERESV